MGRDMSFANWSPEFLQTLKLNDDLELNVVARLLALCPILETFWIKSRGSQRGEPERLFISDQLVELIIANINPRVRSLSFRELIRQLHLIPFSASVPHSGTLPLSSN